MKSRGSEGKADSYTKKKMRILKLNIRQGTYAGEGEERGMEVEVKGRGKGNEGN